MEAKGHRDGSANVTRRRREIRYILSFAILAGLLLIFLVWNICAGSVSISLEEITKSILGQEIGDTAANILWKIRLPRALAAVILGGALALSGYLLQTFFHNPIAGPFVLGISSGAKLTVALVMVFSLGNSLRASSALMIIAAFAGAMLSMGFVLLMSRKVQRMSMLIISGVMIGYICSAITDLVVTFADDADIVNLHNWSKGSFSGITWENVAVMAVVVFIVFFIIFLMSKPISAYQMGESYARNMGVNVKALRIALILLSSLLSACVTAFAGPISFVGIAVPHLIKLATHTAKPIILIPGCFLGGAVITLFCDGIARTVFAPTEISISSVTAVFLVPVVIAAMLRKQRM